ncbi:MAG: 4-hydroxy-tetrahydrodipicolinate reductase [Alphaproteobacteria bacterium]|nr:4-hydroxy-tetrahydrodipicolinate reductase [Alphaproteobacteria bacterium]
MQVGVVGCNGRVGKLIVKELLSGNWADKGLLLAGGTARDSSNVPDGCPAMESESELFEKSDVVIDFTLPEGTRKHVNLAAQHKTPIVIGTTGLTQEDEEFLQQKSKEVCIVYAANMSVGVNLLLDLVEKAASCLEQDWDIEIFETHHKYKVDAPSGTALALGKAAASGRNGNLDVLADYERHGNIGSREKGKIGFSVARGGDVVGEHTVFFFGEGERIELTHRATDRRLFAKGALRAALWCKEKPAGLYSMRDVLDL